MDNQQIASLLSQIADSDEIIRQSPILLPETESHALPLLSVNFQTMDLLISLGNGGRISDTLLGVPVFELGVDRETFRNTVENVKALAKIRDALIQRHTAELQLALLHGVVCYSGIPHARELSQRIDPNLPDRGGVDVRLDDFGDPFIGAPLPIQEPPGQSSDRYR